MASLALVIIASSNDVGAKPVYMYIYIYIYVSAYVSLAACLSTYNDLYDLYGLFWNKENNMGYKRL